MGPGERSLGAHVRFTVILCNDLHMGEAPAGLVGGQPQFIGIEQTDLSGLRRAPGRLPVSR